MKQKSLQFPQTSVVVFSYDQAECIFNVSLLDLDFCLEFLTAFNVVN